MIELSNTLLVVLFILTLSAPLGMALSFLLAASLSCVPFGIIVLTVLWATKGWFSRPRTI